MVPQVRKTINLDWESGTLYWCSAWTSGTLFFTSQVALWLPAPTSVCFGDPLFPRTDLGAAVELKPVVCVPICCILSECVPLSCRWLWHLTNSKLVPLTIFTLTSSVSSHLHGATPWKVSFSNIFSFPPPFFEYPLSLNRLPRPPFCPQVKCMGLSVPLVLAWQSERKRIKLNPSSSALLMKELHKVELPTPLTLFKPARPLERLLFLIFSDSSFPIPANPIYSKSFSLLKV